MSQPEATRETAMQILAGNRNLTPSFGFKATTPASRIKESGVSHMKSNSRMSWMGIVLLMLALPLPALAALGGDVSTVQEDKAQMKGDLKTTEATNFTLHEIKAPTGIIVREYASPTGEVFGVSWQGPAMPNLQQILGSYFQTFSEAAQAQRAAHRGHGPLYIQEPGLVVESTGHMRAFSGRAYDPAKLPQGVNASDIR
jgi:hypothetical protein